LETDIDELITDFSKFYMLTILYEGPLHGYSIMTTLGKRLGREVSASLVYPFLRSLEERGFVQHTVVPVGKRDRKVYELTEKGHDLCRRLFERFGALVATAIEPTLDVCAHCGCKVYEGGFLAEIDGKDTMFCCEHCAAHYQRERSGH
jgi:DNA-binding PadR family transcriptional regulator